MFVSIVGWITGGMLVAASALVILGAYLERSQVLCRENCTDFWVIVPIVVLGLLGALVSVTVNQLSGTRPLLIKRLIGAGGAVFVMGSIGLVVVAPVSFTLVFLLAALTVVIMITWVLSRPDSSLDHGHGRNSR